MKKRFIALGIVTIIVASLATGYLVGSGRIVVPYIPKGGSSSSTTSTSVICSISGPTNGVELRVVENNYSANSLTVNPVVGASVSGSNTYFCDNVRSESNFTPTVTNSSGWADLLFGGGGLYSLSINYDSPVNYTLSVPTSPLATTFAVYNISTGNLTTTICYYGEHCYSG